MLNAKGFPFGKENFQSIGAEILANQELNIRHSIIAE